MKATLGRWAENLLFTRAEIGAVETLSPHFKRLELKTEPGVRCTPGDKLQLHLGEMALRTYTPIRWKSADGTFDLLAYLHGESPGTRWAGAAKAGDVVHYFGPRGSLSLAASVERAVVFGDETSFAVAHALSEGRKLKGVFEVNDVDEARRVLLALGLDAEVVRRGDGHLERIATLLSANDDTLVMTGNALSIQALKRAMAKKRGPTKAYWAPGKVGLD